MNVKDPLTTDWPWTVLENLRDKTRVQSKVQRKGRNWIQKEYPKTKSNVILTQLQTSMMSVIPPKEK